MTDLFEQVTNSQDVFKKLASKIPGFSGYVERQNRRAADKLMRETIADRFQEQWARTSQLQTDMISAGMLSYVDDMERAAIQMRTFIDKIRTASYGYSGLFDAVKINEEELAKLYSFDQGFFLAAEELGRALDNVEATLGDEAGLPAAIRNVATLARQSTEAFERRSEVFTSEA